MHSYWWQYQSCHWRSCQLINTHIHVKWSNRSLVTGSQRLSLRVINDVRVSDVAVNIRFNDTLRSVCPCYVERWTWSKIQDACVKGLLDGICCINNIIIAQNFYKWVFTVVVIMQWGKLYVREQADYQQLIFTAVTLGNSCLDRQTVTVRWYVSAHGNSIVSYSRSDIWLFYILYIYIFIMCQI